MGSRLVFRPDESPDAARALRAWHQLTRTTDHVRVERLVKERTGKPYTKSSLFRLFPEGVNGRPVVAKRARTQTVDIEALVYASILPRLSLTAPRFHGSVRDGDLSWLFIDEVQGNRFAPESQVHRRLAVEWLSALHTGTSTLPLDDLFPPNDFTLHERYLDSARSRIVHGLGAFFVPSGERSALEDVVHLIDRIAENWAEMAERCGCIPSCLAHADFAGKNVLVSHDERTLFVLDWESAGWGPPAMDLEHLECNAYYEAVSDAWPGVGSSDVVLLKSIGVMVRAICILDAWASGLAKEWAGYATGHVLASAARLRTAFLEAHVTA